MAKPFYSLEEVSEQLGKSEDEIRELVREGTLREFRDAGKIFFKAEDVQKLGGSAPDDDEISLEPIADESPDRNAPDTGSGGTSVIGLAAVDDSDDSGPLGVSEPPPPPREPESESATGIGVFDDDELEIDADPMAKTQITSAKSGQDSGSGSGLLDLTRESDDTSLGAELLDEIYPGEEHAADPLAGADDSDEPADAEEAEPEDTEPVEEEAPTVPAEVAAPAPATTAAVTASDPNEGIFAGLLVGMTIVLAVSASVIAGILQGFLPAYANYLSNNFWIFLGAAAGLPLITLIIGWIVGRGGSGGAPKPRAAKQPARAGKR